MMLRTSFKCQMLSVVFLWNITFLKMVLHSSTSKRHPIIPPSGPLRAHPLGCPRAREPTRVRPQGATVVTLTPAAQGPARCVRTLGRSVSDFLGPPGVGNSTPTGAVIRTLGGSWGTAAPSPCISVLSELCPQVSGSSSVNSARGTRGPSQGPLPLAPTAAPLYPLAPRRRLLLR